MLSSTTRFILANFFTPSYRILGRVEIGSAGLIGLLNDPNSSSIEVTQASLARLRDPRAIVDKPSLVRLVKKGILVVGVSRETEVGPSMMARAGYGRVDRHPIRAVSSKFELSGHVEWSGRFDLSTVILEGGDFIAMYDVVLRAIDYQDLNLKSPAVVVNRRKLDILMKGTEPASG